MVTGEKLTQIIAYPISGKPIHVAPLAHAMFELRKRLEEADQCIIIGYSMRDQHILDIFTESTRRNDKLKILHVDPNSFSIKNEIENDALKRVIIPASFNVEEILHESKILKIINALKVAYDQSMFDAMKNPFKTTQNYFHALDYKTALKLIESDRFWQECQNIDVGHLDFQNILGGLSYTHMIAKFSRDTELERTALELVAKLLIFVSRSPREFADLQAICDRAIMANEWVRDYLQGNYREGVLKITEMRIKQMRYAIKKLQSIKDAEMEDRKKVLGQYATILFKFSTEEKTTYDDVSGKWILG